MKKHISLILLSALIVLSVTPSYAKNPVTDGETDPVMLDLDPYMIEALRGSEGNGVKGRYGKGGGIVDLMKEVDFKALVEKHDLKLFNGPMLGDIRATSAKIWIRSAGPATYQIAVGELRSKPLKITAETDYTGVATIEGLKPFTEYRYRVILDGKEIKKDHFILKTAPQSGQAAKFSLTFGSGARYMPVNEGIWRTMAKQRPMAYLGLGDNVYIDVPDYQNVQRLHYYRRMLRQEYREMIASSGIYAIWDDHDMAKNDSEGGYGLNTAPWKQPNFKVFEENWNNPFNGEPKNPGTYFNFKIGDVEVFMTDGRFYRYGKKSIKQNKKIDPNAKVLPTTMLGEKQKLWLLNALKKSDAKFKVIASGTMWHDLADKGGADSWAGKDFRAERDEIFDLIDKEKINGVLLISGDRHRTDIWKTERPKGYALYEFLSAKMTNLHGHEARKEALWSHSPGAGNNQGEETFWGQLDFDLTKDDPTVTFRAINQDGKELKAFPLPLSEISHR